MYFIGSLHHGSWAGTIVRHYNDEIAATAAKAPASCWGMGSLNPLDKTQIKEGERCMGELGMKGLLVCSSWHGRFIELHLLRRLHIVANGNRLIRVRLAAPSSATMLKSTSRLGGLCSLEASS